MDMQWFESVLMWLFKEVGFVTIPIILCNITEYEYDERNNRCCIRLNREFMNEVFTYADKNCLRLEHGNEVGVWEISNFY